MDTDLALLRRYQRHHDPEAFRQIVEAHGAMVRATACRVMPDSSLAMDVAQEAFLALARHHGEPIRCVGAWLHQAALRKAQMTVRSESRRQAGEAAAAEQWMDPNKGGEGGALLDLDGALAALPDSMRVVLVEHYLEGRTQQEIARRTGQSQASVSRLLERGLALMLARLRECRPMLSGAGLAALLVALKSEAASPQWLSSLSRLGSAGGAPATVPACFLPGLLPPLVMNIKTVLMLLAALATLTGTIIGSRMADVPGASTKQVPAVAVSEVAEGGGSKESSAPDLQAWQQAGTKARVSSVPLLTPPSSVSLARLRRLSQPGDFKAFLLRIYNLRDPEKVAAELWLHLGLKLTAADLKSCLRNPSWLEAGIFGYLGHQQPASLLAWMAMCEERSPLMMMTGLSQVMRRYPGLTAEQVDAFLPEGPRRELVLSALRAQQDPRKEAARILAETADAGARRERLWLLAETWPKAQAGEAARWVLQNLGLAEQRILLPRLAQKLSATSAEDTAALLRQIQDPELLTHTLVDTMHYLVERSSHVSEVIEVIGRLEGRQRAYAISELARRWVRSDQPALMAWVNSLESPADFEAALPLTLAQLSPENYQSAMNTLMSQLDRDMEAALIRSAMPDINNATHASQDIIQRLTQLPQYRTIGSGRQDHENGALLWTAVNRVAEGWVQHQGAAPEDGARWIDGLPFSTPADKAMVAGKLYQQWRLSAPEAAARWALGAGVVVR